MFELFTEKSPIVPQNTQGKEIKKFILNTLSTTLAVTIGLLLAQIVVKSGIM